MSIVGRIGQSIRGIEATYEKFDGSAFNNGEVAKYTAAIHKKLLKEVIGLFQVIVEFPDLFTYEFSYNQMNDIAILAESLVVDPYDGSALNKDENRTLISRMRVVFGEKEALQYKSKVNKLQGLIVRVEDMLKEEKRVSSMKEVIEGINAQLEDITKIQEQAQAGLVAVQGKDIKANGILENVNTASKEIEDSRSAIVAFFGEIEQYQKDLKTSQTESTEFVQIMKGSEEEYKEKREGNLQELETQKVKFHEKLKTDYAEYLKKRDEMEKTAKRMLGLANASGLAAAFSQRIDKGKWNLLWVGGALFFIIGAMVIAALTNGVNIPNIPITAVVFDSIWARISITTLPLLAAYFCAAQYLQSERTVEDYRYKKALAQSMPAFMEQLGKSNEGYRHAYLSLALQQMLQDPLRKKHDVPLPVKDFLETLFEKSPKNIALKKKDDIL